MLRLSPFLACCVWIVPLSGVAGAAPASKPSLSNWTAAKHGKVLTPAKAPPPAKVQAAKAQSAKALSAKTPPPAPAPRAAVASGGGKSKGKSEGPSVNGKVAVFGFSGEGAAHVQQAVVSTLRTRGLQVTTGLRPVDTAEQFREMAATLRLAAYIEGTVGGDESHQQATVHVRSGVTGRRIASVHFSGDHGGLAADIGSGLWVRTGGQLTRLCAEAAKPHKGGRGAMRINAGTPIENSAPDDYIPPHLRNEPPKGRQKDDPWDEGT